MIRGTTPTHYFNISLDTSEIKSLKIIYAQDDEVITKKNADDCELTGNTIKTTLTQDETLKFDCKKRVQIQIRIITKSGASLASYIKAVPVHKCLDNEVLT